MGCGSSKSTETVDTSEKPQDPVVVDNIENVEEDGGEKTVEENASAPAESDQQQSEEA